MGFYKNTHTEIIRIIPKIVVENNTSFQRPNVAIPVGSVCSFNSKDFGYPSDDPVVYLRCIRSPEQNCIGCYFRYRSSTFCPVCCKAERPDNSDVIFEEFRV